jgi:arylamine N-acetyltransferase
VERLTDALAAAYLARIAVAPGAPSVAGLFALHTAHVDKVSYETLWIHLGEQRGIAPADSAHEIARRGRGGYCFQLNGAFSTLIATLGYRVTRHLGAVHAADGPPAALGNHMVLLVHDLPDESNPGGTWYVDVGLGDGLMAPMPLMVGSANQAPFTVALRHSPWPIATWSFAHDAAGSFPGMVFSDTPVEVTAFAGDHHELSTSPTSTFTTNLLAIRRDGSTVHRLRNDTLTLVTAEGQTSTRLDADAFWRELAERFLLDVSAIDVSARGRLWARVEQLAQR